CSERQSLRAALRSPLPAALAMVRSVSVTLAMALTTTIGCCAWRPWTIEATRSMALASSTEVPPNFMTIMGGAPGPTAGTLRVLCMGAQAAAETTARYLRRWAVPSSQVAFGLQQFRVQQSCAGGASDGVVGQNGKLPVQNSAGPQAAYGGGHARAHVHVESRLRAVAGFKVDNRAFRRAGKFKLLRFG